MSTPFSAQFPDAAECEERLDQTAQVPASGDEPTGEHPAVQARLHPIFAGLIRTLEPRP